MTFWLIVLGVIAVVLLLAWRHDRRRGVQVSPDLDQRAHRLRGETQATVTEYNPGHTAGPGTAS